MAEDVFASYGLQNCQGLFRVADALHRKNQSREAVWRVLTTNAVLGDRELLGSFRNHLNDMTHRLVKSWELFHDEQQADAFQTRLSELFYDHSMAWLSLLKLRKRISLSPFTLYEGAFCVAINSQRHDFLAPRNHQETRAAIDIWE